MFTWFNNRKHKKGFMLVEVLVVVVTVGILSASIIPKVSTETDRAKEAGIDVAFRSFYLSSKTATILNDTSDYSTLGNFEKIFNENSTAEIKFNGGKGNIRDPWDNKYELFVGQQSDPNDDNTYIVFTSRGVSKRDGFVFEPETMNNRVRWTPKDNILNYHRYYLLIGRTTSGKPVTDLTEEEAEKIIKDIVKDDPSPEDPDGTDPDGTGDEGKDNEDEDQWARLGFIVETDGIMIDTGDEEDEGDIYYKSYIIGEGDGTGNYPTDNGKLSGNPLRVNLKGFIDMPVFPTEYDFNIGGGGLRYSRDMPILPAYYLMDWDKKYTGNSNGYGGLYTEVASSFGTTGTTIDGSNEYINDINKGTVITEKTGKIEMEIAVGNNNKIKLIYDKVDAHPTTKMFKVGTSVTMEAVPSSPNYKFSYWRVDGVKDKSSDIKTITVERDTTFTGVFRMDLDVTGGKLFTQNKESFTDYYNNEMEKESITDTWSAGDLGKDVTATLTESGKLKIKATGIDPIVTKKPWDSKKDLINEVVIGKDITVYGDYLISNYYNFPFDGYKLETLILEGNNRVRGLNFRKTTIENVTIGDGLIFESARDGVTNQTFHGIFEQATIGNLTVGKDSILYDRVSAFRATSIRNLTIDSDIPSSGFQNTGLKTLNVGPNVTNIGDSAFSGCDIQNTPDLSNIDSFGNSAFNGALKNAETINIKQGIAINSGAFAGCNIKTLNLEGNNEVEGTAFENLKATNVNIGKDSNLKIETRYSGNASYYGVFDYAVITNVNIAENVILETRVKTFDNTSAFGGRYDAAKIENLTINSNIPECGFYNTDIKTLNIGPNITSIGREAFYGCNSLPEAKIDNALGNVTIQSNSFPSTTNIIYLK